MSVGSGAPYGEGEPVDTHRLSAAEPRCCTGGRTGLEGRLGGKGKRRGWGAVEANLLTLSAWCHARFTMRGNAPLAEYVHGSQEMEGGERR